MSTLKAYNLHLLLIQNLKKQRRVVETIAGRIITINRRESLWRSSVDYFKRGYEDDIDFGDFNIYTGHGGNDLNTKKQIADQSWESIVTRICYACVPIIMDVSYGNDLN